MQEGGSGAAAEVTAELESQGLAEENCSVFSVEETVSVRRMPSRVQVTALQVA